MSGSSGDAGATLPTGADAALAPPGADHDAEADSRASDGSRPDASPPDAAAVPGDVWAALPAGAPLNERSSGGRRLEARYGKTAEGQRLFRTFFDKMLGVACSFATAADGKTRCLPAVVASRYADQACTEPLLIADDACASELVGKRLPNGRVGVYRLRPAAVPGKVFGRQSSSSPCVADERPQRPLFALGDEVPAESFVAADPPRPQNVPGKRVVPYVRVAEDGTVERVGLYDLERKVYCQADVTPDGKYRCIPYYWYSYPTSAFADDHCTQPVTLVTNVPSEPVVFKRGVSGTCPLQVALFRGVALPAGTKIFVKEGAGGCAAATAPPTGTLYTPGEEIPPGDWVEMTAVTTPQRVEERRLATPDGVTDIYSGLWDKQFMEPCNFERLSDGSLRCLPRVTTEERYTDAACSRRAAPAPRSSTTCDRPSLLHAALVEGPWCKPTVAPVRLSSLPAAATFGWNGAGQCVSVASAGERAVTEPLDPGMFVSGEEVSE